MRYYLLLLILFWCFFSFSQDKVNKPQFVPNVLVVKFKASGQATIDERLQKILNKYNAEIKQLFPTHIARNSKLTLFYEVKFNAFNVQEVTQSLYRTGYFQYVEQKVLNQLYFVPNDPGISDQWYLDTLKAYQAWDIETGDTTMVIGIIDTGIDIDHEDLQGAIKYNYNDPIDGIDNDGDGYTDNFRGWDLSDNDNLPQEPAAHQHGTSVAGCVAPVINNGKGIAGVGYQCKILPIKVASDASSAFDGLDKGYEGIVYAADHGAKIINCSWGSSYASQYGKDIIEYAQSKGCLIVAAAGNTSSNQPHYPAAFEGVLSVANTMKTDVLAPTSGRGYWVDICAPGSDIYTTFDGNNYNFNSGTSYASPIAAGCAGLVWSKFENYSAQQVAERLKATAQNINSIIDNQQYRYQLGDGRINLYNALTKTNLPSIVVDSYQWNDGNDNLWKSGDTILLSANFTNLLDSTGGVIAKLRTTSSYITLIDTTFTIGSLDSAENKNNNASPYRFSINSEVPLNQSVILVLYITDDNGYQREVPVSIDINNYFVDVTINDLWLTVSSDGQLGYYQEDQAAGLGIQYQQNASLLYEGSLMIGLPGKVVDRARGLGTTNDKDFYPVYPTTKVEVSTSADEEVVGSFNDSTANSIDKLGVLVVHKTLAWNKSGHNDYVIQEYTVINQSSDVLDSLYIGLFADWDIGSANNIISSDLTKGIAYCYEPGGNVYVGVKELTHFPFIQNAMYNNDSDGAGINPNNNFSSNKKYRALSEFNGWAGWGSGQDVSHVVSAGAFTINVNDSVTVAFAIMAGNSLTALQQTADSANMQYKRELISSINELVENSINVYPNPVQDVLLVNTNIQEEYQVKIIDVLGKQVYAQYNSGNAQIDVSKLSSGIYNLIVLKNNNQVHLQKMMVR